MTIKTEHIGPFHQIENELKKLEVIANDIGKLSDAFKITGNSWMHRILAEQHEDIHKGIKEIRDILTKNPPRDPSLPTFRMVKG